MFNKLVSGGNADLVVRFPLYQTFRFSFPLSPLDAEDILQAPPADRPPTRFLSRYDKSATNIKESELFINIGQVCLLLSYLILILLELPQVPWALVYSKWYHQYPRFPIQALKAAAVLDEYTLTDRGTWLSSDPAVTSDLVIYKQGGNSGDTTVLLNPCTALVGARAQDVGFARKFMAWLLDSEGGQTVIAQFKKGGQVLYTPAVQR